ncbi:hypothetical protein [Parvibaculum sp.]|uniref:hypothetical protein n=1 Tax=Parvibaculum sp. TaxID=2024848 RepID=UPI001D8F1E39|nr:hypothetical protein [Parvibaculum sp.]MBX3487867.1 hypothetical protein [Parvibaculum sp.]
MLTIDELPGQVAPIETPPFQKQIRFIDRYGKILLVEDVTDIFEATERRGKCGWAEVHRNSISLYPDETETIETLVFWPCEQKFVITSKFNVAHMRRVREAKPEHDAVLERRWAAMARGRDW